MDCDKNSLDKYHCKQCNFKTNIRVFFWDHFQKVYSKNQRSLFISVCEDCYLCRYCSFSTFSLLVLLKHNLHCQDITKKKQTIIAKYQCSYCSYKTTRNYTLRIHILYKHKADQYKSGNKDSLFYCNHCEFKSKRRNNLKIHIHRKHTPQENVPKYECNTCNYKTIRNDYLKLHIIRRHTVPEKTQLYKCEYCAYRSKTKRGLTRHINVQHMLEIKNKKADVKKHILTKHTPQENVLKFECNTCKYTTIHKENLKMHIIRRHTESDEVQCEHCTYRNITRSAVAHHVEDEHMLKEGNKKIVSSTEEEILPEYISIFKEDIKRRIINAIQVQKICGDTNVKTELTVANKNIV